MMRACGLLLCATACAAEVHYKEIFDGAWESRWVNSAKKDGLGEFKRAVGTHFGDKEINHGIKTSQDAKFYAIGSKFPKSFTNKDKPLVISFTVKHEQGIDCGGGYVKVMPEMDPKDFDGDSEYFIMFGPDICGATKKIHFIFGYKGENLLWKKEPRAEDDKLTHQYTAIINPDGTYEVQVDGVKKESGSLEEDWAFLKPKEIDDPEDKKPSDWVDEAEIDDPEDKKPEDWGSEPEEIADPSAEKPDDWDEEDDGTWEAPMIPNPKFQGEWKAKKIPNPAYKGQWKAKRIANPEYETDSELYLARKPLGAIGIDVWQVKSGTIFDNIIIADNMDEVKKFQDETYHATIADEKKSQEDAEAAARAEAEAKAKEAGAAGGESEEEEDEEEED